MKKSTAHIFAGTLKQIGIRYVFGVPSGSMIDYIQAIHDTQGIDFILTAHEGAAAFMACVCGRLTGIPGACFATFGPGATNLSTGVGAAFLDRAPMLAFTDEMPEALRGRTVQMNIDHQALFSTLTKHTCRLDPAAVQKTLLTCAQLARTDLPGPVHVGIPSDISQIRTIASNDMFHSEKGINSENPGSASLSQAAGLLARAKKPVLVLGLGAAKKALKPLINRLADKIQLPVLLTAMAKGIISEDHPFYAGVLNHALSDKVAEIHRQADLILAIGYDPVEINYEEWAKNIPVIHLHSVQADVDPFVLESVINVTGDIGISVQKLLQMKFNANHWNPDSLIQNKIEMLNRLLPSSSAFGPCALLKTLREQLPPDGILTCDVGAHLHLVGQMWQTPDPEKLLITNGWSSMGFAVPAAIAARLCRPDHPVVCLVGDGGFMMAAGELLTARRLNLDIVFIVLLDHHLSLIRIKQDKKHYNSGYGTQISTQDILDEDRFLGIPVLGADCQKNFQKAVKKALQKDGPSIIKAVIDPSEYDGILLRGN